jgi:nucleotide-binding universal stress UspA family protein
MATSHRIPVMTLAHEPDDPGLAHAAIHHILFPSDLSAASDRAFDHARLLAATFEAPVTLYHVVELKRGQSAQPQEPERERLRRAENFARGHLADQAQQLASLGRVVVERTSSPAEAVVALIQAFNPDLTVMATRGCSGLAQIVLGSVTDHVVRKAGVPVMCVREPDHGVALPYRRILVPTDLSPASRRAFPLAALLAQRFGAEVMALHVVARPTRVSLSGVPDFVERQIPSEAALAAFVEPAFRGAKVSTRVELGSAWDRIVETARLERTDLIVMSTHGHDSLADRLLGSHTERVVGHAPCPVLVI